MKFTVTAVALAALAHASPVPSETELAPRLLDLDLGLNTGHDNDDDSKNVPFTFTSTYAVIATPEQVVGMDNQPTGGLEGASGLYLYGINSIENIICYNITLEGFRGEYQSMALTSTHIHEAPKGRAGPPRIVFPDPVGPENGHRRSIGCVQGPFKTGIVTNGVDSGDGFHVSQIEENPCGFFTDVHSSLAVPGAVRGQLCESGCA